MSFAYATRWLSSKFRRELGWLRELKPLPTTHYHWTLPDAQLNQPDERVTEFCRITWTVCFQGEWVTLEQFKNAAKLCDATGCAVGINLKPYHEHWPHGNNPTAPTSDYTNWLITRLNTLKQWANDYLPEGRHRVTAMLLDSEIFTTGNYDRDTAITAKYDAVYDLCKQIFPSASVEWYSRGIYIGPCNPDGTCHQPWNTYENKADSFSCDLYRVWEPMEMQETFRRAVKFAGTKVLNPMVTPWIALGAGYVRGFDSDHVFEMNVDYPLINDWQLGRQINVPWFGTLPERFAPWGAAKCCVFYPGPWDARCPNWCRHFVSYARGALEIKELP